MRREGGHEKGASLTPPTVGEREGKLIDLHLVCLHEAIDHLQLLTVYSNNTRHNSLFIQTCMWV